MLFLKSQITFFAYFLMIAIDICYILSCNKIHRKHLGGKSE
jgi:hypothetical protein